MTIFLGIILAIVLYVIYTYNRIITLKQRVINSKKDISIQLDRRGKVFDSLINTVKKAMDYEKSTLKEIVELRQKAINLKGVDEKQQKEIEDQLSKIIASGQLSSSINMTMEAYPELKANDNMKQLQEEIVSTENKLSYAKQGYNAAVEEFNATVQSFPANIIVDKFDLNEEFEYWDIPEEKIQQEEDRRVSFD